MQATIMARCVAAVLLLAIFAACAGPSRSYKTNLRSLLASSDYPLAIAEIQKKKEKEYGKKNAVLYYLDLGMAQHDAGLYKESEQSFSAAEERMDELFTKSISKGATSFLFNDNTKDYPGEAFERTLLNIFRAVNYLSMGNREDALVEARKVTNFLTELSDKRGYKTGYRDDAFAQYLSSMLYEDGGFYDDARICMEAAMSAYKWYEKEYGTPTPKFENLKNAPKESGEIVFLHYSGIAPIKSARTFQVTWNEGLFAVQESGDAEGENPQFKNALMAGIFQNNITISYPEYVSQNFLAAGSEISAGGRKAESVLMEDISAIAKKELAQRVAAVKVKSVARAFIKYVLAQAVSKKAEKEGGKGLGTFTKILTSAVSAATEVADTRCWGTLPAQIRMSRMKVLPGKHDVSVSFKDGAGAVLATQVFKGVEVKQGQRTYLHYRTAR